MKCPRHALVGLVLLACTGCGEVLTVSGTVTRAGRPVEDATIHFRPKSGTKGPAVSSKISSGRYRIPAKEGLQTGHYVVEVSLPVARHKFERPTKNDESFEFERQIPGQNAHIDFEL